MKKLLIKYMIIFILKINIININNNVHKKDLIKLKESAYYCNK